MVLALPSEVLFYETAILSCPQHRSLRGLIGLISMFTRSGSLAAIAELGGTCDLPVLRAFPAVAARAP